MKVYIVISAHGDYEDYRENIEGVFSSRAKALEFMNNFDEEHYIEYDSDKDRDEFVYNIVPRDIFDSWPYTEPEKDEDELVYDKEYCGYTIDDYHKQEDRVDLWYQNYSKCHIEVYDVM